MPLKKLIVNVSDARISSDIDDILITYSLGSCIGICLYDPFSKTAGMLHYQLPESSMDPQRARENPFMFADTGTKILVGKMLSLGANKKRIHVKVAGGAIMSTGPKGFDIGKRNFLAIRKIMWQNGMFIDAEDVGGEIPRNMYLRVSDGSVTIKSGEKEKTL